MKEPNLPPANIEAEEAILGGILFDPKAIFQVEASLVPSAFYVSAHQEIYQTTLKLYHQGNPTDFMAVSTYLADRDRLDQVGGTAKLAQLLNRTISAVNIDRYVDLAKPREAQHSGAAECLDESWAGSSLAYFDSRYNFLIQIL